MNKKKSQNKWYFHGFININLTHDRTIIIAPIVFKISNYSLNINISMKNE